MKAVPAMEAVPMSPTVRGGCNPLLHSCTLPAINIPNLFGSGRRHLASSRGADRTLQDTTEEEATAGFEVKPSMFEVDMKGFQESSSSIASTATSSFLAIGVVGIFSLMM